MPSRRTDIDHEAHRQEEPEDLTPDEVVSQATNDFPLGAGVVDPLYGRGGSAGFTNPRGPLAEEAVQSAAKGDVQDLKPEGWDDPWYWENASDADIPDNLSPAQEAVFALHSYYLFGDSHSYHFGSAGSARVETEAIRTCAASGKNTLEQIEELIQSMVSYVTASEAYWRGTTGDFFREGFVGGMKALSHDLQNLAPYTRELIAYADMYDEVITETNVIAEGIGDVIWQDV